MKFPLNEHQAFLLFAWIANLITAILAINWLCWLLHFLIRASRSRSSIEKTYSEPENVHRRLIILEIIHKIGGWWSLRRHLGLAPFLVAASMLYGFLFTYGLDSEYRPWDARLKRGLLFTIQGHVGLWLAMMDIRGKTRFVVAMIFLPSLFGIPLLWWNLHISLAVFALMGVGWLMFRVLKEK